MKKMKLSDLASSFRCNKFEDYICNKVNLRDLIAVTGLVISNWIQIVNFSTRVTMKFDGVSEWVIKFNGLSRTADSEVHIVHISRVIIACTLKSLSPPT